MVFSPLPLFKGKIMTDWPGDEEILEEATDSPVSDDYVNCTLAYALGHLVGLKRFLGDSIEQLRQEEDFDYDDMARLAFIEEGVKNLIATTEDTYNKSRQSPKVRIYS